MPADTIQTLAFALSDALRYLRSGLGGKAEAAQLLSLLGWELPPAVADIGLAGLDVSALLAKIEVVFELRVSISVNGDGSVSGTTLAGAYADLLVEATKFVQALVNLADNLPVTLAASGDYVSKTQIEKQLPIRLVDLVLMEYLMGEAPFLFLLLHLLGIVSLENYPADHSIYQTAHIRHVIYYDRIGLLFSNFTGLLNQVYGWGSATFDPFKLLIYFGRLLQFSGAQGRLLQLPRRVEEKLLGRAVPEADTTPMPQFLIALTEGTGTISGSAGISAYGLRPSAPGGIDGGIGFYPFLRGTADLSFPLDKQLFLDIDSTVNLAGGVVLFLRPGQGLTAKSSFLGSGAGAAMASGRVGIRFRYGTATGTPITLVGLPGGSTLQAQQMFLGAGAQDNGGAFDAFVEAGIKGGQLLITLDGADGFLKNVFPDGGIKAGFDLVIGWSSDRGVYFQGGAQLQLSLPLHLSLGPIDLKMLTVQLSVPDGALQLETSFSAGLELGPIQATVDRIGITTGLKFQPGNLGILDFRLAFKPPEGLGLAIDLGVVSGGGYIGFNPAKGQYSGILQLSLLDTIQITVIGVLDTIMPDGSDGFSFLLIITFTFPPIQLSFGFTLNGVGGLGGVNRTMSVDALHAGFRAHTLNSVLFPPDPIANSSQIISDIRNFFPPAQGRYLFGPLLQLGWGTPTLITLTLGVILEIPDPIRIAILGLIDAGLPDKDLPLIELHIDILGIVDFGAKTLSIDGSLYDSHVLIYGLSGDLAFRLSWGDNPNFVYSLGGFNPHFNTDGLGVPQLKRMSVSIGDGDNPRISSNSYMAVTSNSLQFGANVEAYASAGGFSIHGYLGFDVLIILSPFSFEFDFSAGFDVAFEGHSLLGLTVNGSLSGPTPWHIHGDATISFLFFSVSASVDLTWGDSTQAKLPAKPVLPDLTQALQDPRSWNSALPEGASVAVTFATLKPDGKTLRVHPIGTLTVKETVVPLDLPITRYGNATPSDGTQFSIQSVQINSKTESIQTIQDYFAPGQFLTLNDADKLSKPSFEKFDAGVTIGSSAIVNGNDSPRTVNYQEIYIDDPAGFSRFSRFYLMPADIHLALSAQGAGFASPVKNTGLAKYSAGPAPSAVAVAEPSYVVTSVTDLAVRSDIVAGGGATYFQAQARLQTHLADHPEDAGQLQVMPAHEVTP